MVRRTRNALCIVVGSMMVAACGGKVLELGHGRDDRADYATPDTIAAEADAGLGVPTVIARHQYDAQGVSVDDTRVYWLSDESSYGGHGFVRSCGKNDCAATLITYTNVSFPWGSEVHKTASNGTYLFWTGSFGQDTTPRILACPIGGCAPVPIEILTIDAIGPTAAIFNFLVDNDALFGLLKDGTIVRCPATGCEGNRTVIGRVSSAPDVYSTQAFAADTDNLYWIEGQGLSLTAGQIMTMPKSGATAPRVLAPAGHLVNALAVSEGNLYWSEGHVNASVKTCVLSNCAQSTTILATAQRYPHYLAVLGDGVWFLCPDGDIQAPWHCNLVDWPVDGDGRMPAAFPIAVQMPSSLAIDATHLYWSTWDELVETYPPPPFPEGGGAVKRLRRPR